MMSIKDLTPVAPSVIGQAEPDCFEYLKKNCVVSNLKKGDIATRKGEVGASTLIVNSGLLVVEVQYPNQKMVPAQFVPPGRGFAPSHGPSIPSEFRIHALADSEVVYVPNNTLFAACELFPKFAQGMVSSLIQRTNDGYLGHARSTSMPLGLQIAYLFWWLSLLQPSVPGQPQVMPWKIPQQILADFFGVPREEVSRKIKMLENQEHVKKVDEGYALFESLKDLFAEYGKPSAPVSFIQSVLAIKS